MFNFISYARRPIRFYRTIRNLITGKEELRLDAALRGITDRIFRRVHNYQIKFLICNSRNHFPLQINIALKGGIFITDIMWLSN
jgi:hypothetical protein